VFSGDFLASLIKFILILMPKTNVYLWIFFSRELRLDKRQK